MSFDRHGDLEAKPEPRKEKTPPCCWICGKELRPFGVSATYVCPLHGSRGVPR